MIKMRKKYFWLMAFVVLLTSVSCYTIVMALESESKELPVPISFVSGSSIGKDMVLLESVYFELSDANPSQIYLITENYENLIFLFKDASAPINFSLKTQNGDSHRGGFGGGAIQIHIKNNSESEFEWSRGVIDSYSTYKQTEIVDYSNGVLEIYQVID